MIECGPIGNKNTISVEDSIWNVHIFLFYTDAWYIFPFTQFLLQGTMNGVRVVRV